MQQIMRRTSFAVAYLALLCAVCAAVYWGVYTLRSRAVALRHVVPSMLGTRLPDVTLLTDRGPYSTASTRRPLVLEVFATWCEVCRVEVPSLNALYAKYGPNIDFLAVTGSMLASDGKSAETGADVLHFAKKEGVMYPVAMDKARVVASTFHVIGFPAIFLVDRAHKVVYQSYGAASFERLDSAIKTMRLDRGTTISYSDR